MGSVDAREKRKSDQTSLVQPVLEYFQVLRLPYSNISWRLLRSRDHITAHWVYTGVLQGRRGVCVCVGDPNAWETVPGYQELRASVEQVPVHTPHVSPVRYGIYPWIDTVTQG